MNHRHGPQTTTAHELNDSHEALHIHKEKTPRSAAALTLDKLPVGKPARVLALNAEGALRRRLLDMGITPRTEIRIQKTAPMGDPLELKLRGYSLSLRKQDAASIDVEPIAEEGSK